MAHDNGGSFNSSPSSVGSDSNKSFAKKVRSRVTGLLPLSLSKWFGREDSKPTVRQREEEDDDDYCSIQPPLKRMRMPSPAGLSNNLHVNSIASQRFNFGDASSAAGDVQGRRSASAEHTGESIASTSKQLFSANSASRCSLSDNLLNGDKDSDSGESTSGYSSMPRLNNQHAAVLEEPKKPDDVTTKVDSDDMFASTSVGGPSRSLFVDRSMSPQINSSLSSRRPSFNASTFGSPNFVDRTLITKRIINSPFYNGRTTYGGASAYTRGRSLRQSRTPLKSHVHVKPVNQSSGASDGAALSKTARRILDTLEQYATPISDAKKIPNPLAKRPRYEGMLSKFISPNPYLAFEHKESPAPPNKELQIPTVPDLLKMKLKERLQDSTVAVRQIATTSKSSLNSDEYKIKSVNNDEPSTITFEEGKSSIKIEQTPSKVVVKQFSAASKPTVSSSNESKAKSSKIAEEKEIPKCVTARKQLPLHENKVTTISANKKSTSESVEYTFASPLVLAENLISIIAINDFKFSDPVYKQKEKATNETALPDNKTAPPLGFKSVSDISLNFKSPDSVNITLKRKNQNSKDPFAQPATQLLSESVDTVFNQGNKTEAVLNTLEKFKPVPGSWECSTCLLRNAEDKLKCSACEGPKNNNGGSTNLDKFKPAPGSWECSSCLLRNAANKTKCVACEAPKNGESSTQKVDKKVGFGEEFKMSADKWECNACLVRNNSSESKCVSCMTPRYPTSGKTSDFGNNFKKKSEEWECNVCLIRNPLEKAKCVACESPKPIKPDSNQTGQLKNPPTVQHLKFGFLPTTTVSNSQSITVPKSEESGIAVTSVSIFGSKDNIVKTTVPITSTIIPPVSTAVVAKPSTAATTPTFTFGIPKSALQQQQPPQQQQQKVKLEEVKSEPPQQKNPIGFQFGSSAVNQTEKSAQPLDNKFQLTPKTEAQTSQSLAPPLNFSFSSSFLKPCDKPFNSANAVSSTSALLQKELTQKPVFSTASFTFGTSTSSVSALKFPVNDAKPLNEGAASSAASMVFTPPKQSLIPNKSEPSPLISKPVIPFAGSASSNTLDKNPFGTLTKLTSTTSSISNVSLPQQTAPLSSSFTFAPTSQTPLVLPTTSTATTTSSLFTFGNKTTTTTTSASMFGSVTTTTSATPSAAPAVFKFGATSPLQQANSNQSMFNAPTNNVFGSTSQSIFGNANKPMFETSATIAAAQPPAFGGSTSSAPSGFAAPETKPFSFGARAKDNSSPAKAPMFSFGQSMKPAEPAKAPAFNNFGSSAATGGFNFGAGAGASAPAVNFNFNPPKVDAPSPFQSPAPVPNIFNSLPAQPQQPLSQPVQNGGFNFNSPANTPAKTGFDFRVAPTAPQFNSAPVAPGGFSFGTPNSNPTQPAAGGFNFGAGAAAPAAFNAKMKPTFNFTGGATPTFSAQPSTENPMAIPRKKIRAVRRTQR